MEIKLGLLLIEFNFKCTWYSSSIVNNEHASTRYDCIDLNFLQINTVIEVLLLLCLHTL